MNFLDRRHFLHTSAAALGALAAPWAWAADETPDALVQRLTTDVLAAIRDDKAVQGGDLERLNQIVNEKIMPNVNFTRMTASATGPAWRRASAAQREKLQAEFKTLLERTYAGALRQVNDQRVEVRPLRAGADDKEVIVRTVVRGQGDPVQLDYRLERTPGQGAGWKIYDLNVMGVWLVDNYRPQFAQQINQGGIDALIDALASRNQANTAAAKR